MKKISLLLLILVTAFVSFSCSSITDAILNVQRLKFKLAGVSGMGIGGVGFGNKSSITDFNLLDGAKLLSSFASGNLNTTLTVNLLAKNPNDGTGGTPNTSAVIKGLAWRFFIDETEILNGNMTNGIEVPGVGKEVTIPIEVGFNLLSFFQGQGYEKLINLALAIGGKSGSASRLQLRIKPTVDTFLGPITYPGEITVIDREFRSQ